MLRTLTRHLAAIAICCVIATAAAVQDQASAEAAVQVHQVNAADYPLVRLYVSVVDESGAPVQGLTDREFEVLESGEEAGDLTCRQLRPGDESMAVVLAIDRSGSMKGDAFERAAEAVTDFARRLNDGDLCAVVPFSSRTDPVLDFTSDEQAVRDFVLGLHAGGDTALNDTVARAAEMLTRRTESREALIVLTDGKDTASAITREQAAERANAAGAAVYCIGLGTDVDRSGLSEIATKTGGVAVFATTPEALVSVYGNLLAALQSRYELAYQSPEGDQLVRTIQVRFALGPDEASAERIYRVPTGSDRGPEGMEPIDILLIVTLCADLLIAFAFIARRMRRGTAR